MDFIARTIGRHHALSRREALAGAAGLVAVAALGPAPAIAGPRIGLWLSDPRLAGAAARSAGSGGGITRIDIGPDLGRQWHGALRGQVRALDGAGVAGLTSWIDFLMLRGCLAEAGYRLHGATEHRGATGQVRAVSWLFLPRGTPPATAAARATDPASVA